MRRQIILFFVMGIVFLIIQIMLFCCNTLARQVPLNYILLIVATLSQSFVLSFICAKVAPKQVSTNWVEVINKFIWSTLFFFSDTLDSDRTDCYAYSRSDSLPNRTLCPLWFYWMRNISSRGWRYIYDNRDCSDLYKVKDFNLGLRYHRYTFIFYKLGR